MKFILTSAFLFCMLSPALSQKTYIPDSNFEQALIFEGLDNVLDDSITTSVIDTLTFLDIGPFSVTDLTGIQDFLALKVLVCRNNYIQQLDLSGNVFLEFLNCENNSLTALNVTNNSLLEQLFAEDNNLANIDLSQNPLLEILDLNQNGVNAIDLSANTALKTVLLSNTSLDDIDLSANVSLEFVDVSVNQLIEIDVANATNLITFLTYGNAITELDVSNNPNLESLLCMGNQITGLDLQANPSLIHIEVYNNNLEYLILPTIDTLSGLSYSLGAGNNAELYCIQCDNPSFVNANWNVNIDAFTVLSEDCGLGINELELDLSVFPNPTLDGMISIKTTTEGSYRFLDLNGMCVDKGELISGTSLVDFTSLNSGIYFLQLEFDNQIVTRKIEIL